MADTTKNAEGLLLVGHGTRDSLGVAEFLDVARQVAVLRPEVVTEPCFLEIAEPNIAAGVAALVDRGVRHITVSPVLLFAAGHAKRDIPEAVQAAVEVERLRHAPHPGPLQLRCAHRRPEGEGELEVRFAPALECHPAIVELSSGRFREALLDKPAVAPADTLLLLVGRGSRDDSATAAMHRFAALRAEQTPVARVEVCFVAMAEPSFASALPRVAELSSRRIVVQPHLLFAGELLAELRAAVDSAASRWPHKDWMLSERLGPDPLVAQAVVDLSQKAPARGPREDVK